MSEIVFEVTGAEEGGDCAKAVGHAFFTQGDDPEALQGLVKGTATHLFDSEAVRPTAFRLHLAREGVVAI